MPKPATLYELPTSRSDFVAHAERRSSVRAADRQEAAEPGSGHENEALIAEPDNAVNKNTARKQALLGQVSLFGW